MRKLRIPYFQIWYSTTYSILFLITLILLAATPGDLIYQSVSNEVWPNLFVIGGTTFLTVVIAILVYSTRLYTNRSVLAAIPKSYLPIERGEVGRSVRKLIVNEWQRSALIAWDSRPRDTRTEFADVDDPSRPGTAEQPQLGARQRGHIRNATVIPVDPKSPSWGEIGHAGWSSPASDDLPDLYFSSVILELPNLIEAKAVSLAPPDPTRSSSGLPIADPRVVALLQRLPGMGLREYLLQLSTLGLISSSELGSQFLTRYEYARFSTRPMTETQFRELMALFTDMLAGMTELDMDLLIEALDDQDLMSAGSASTRSLMPRSEGFGSDTGSIRRYETPRMSSFGVRSSSMVTAPSQMSRMLQSESTRPISDRSRPSEDPYTLSDGALGADDADTSSLSSGLDSIRSTQSVLRHPSMSAG